MRLTYYKFTTYIEKIFRVDARYFLHGGFWLTLTQAIVIIAGIATTALFAHFLSETNYGVYRYLIGLAVIFSSFSLTGLGQAILQTSAKKYYAFYQETIKINFVYSLGISLVGTLGGIYYLFNNNTILALGCVLIAFIQPIVNSYQYIPAFLQGRREFHKSTTVQSIKVILVSTISIITLLLSQSVIFLFLSYLLSQAVINYLSHFFYKKAVTVATPSNIYREYVSYAKHTSLRNIIFSISNRLDVIIVFTQIGAAGLAIYTIATVVPEQLKASFKNLASLLLPKYASSVDIEKNKRALPRRTIQLFLLLCLVTVTYIFVAPTFYKIIFPKYEEAIFLSQITALAFPSFAFLVPYSFFQATKDERKLYEITLYGSILQLVSVIFLVLGFGLMGAILAKIIYRYFVLFISIKNLYTN